MLLTIALMVLWVWLWIKFVIPKAFPYMERMNQFLLGLVAGVLTQVVLDLLYFILFVK